MKGMILAGGYGERLYPTTLAISKPLLPVYDKPMIYYPISILMEFGINDIIIVVNRRHLKLYKNLLNDGGQLGVNFTFVCQDEKIKGTAAAVLSAENFISKSDIMVIYGDNIIISKNIITLVTKYINDSKAIFFGYKVENPESFGVYKFREGKIYSIEEKVKNPPSNYAMVGLFYYKNELIEKLHKVKLSIRNELELTDVNNIYLQEGSTSVFLLNNNDDFWKDAGNPEDLYSCSKKIKEYQDRNNYLIGCIEEIAFNKEFISYNEFIKLKNKYKKSSYGNYLNNIIENVINKQKSHI